MAEKLQGELLQAVARDGGVPDSGKLAAVMGVDHNTLVGAIKSLLAYDMIATEVRQPLFAAAVHQYAPSVALRSCQLVLMSAGSDTLAFLYVQDIAHSRLKLTSEAEGYLQSGSPEAQVFAAVPADGCPVTQLKVLALRPAKCSTPLSFSGGGSSLAETLLARHAGRLACCGRGHEPGHAAEVDQG